MAAPMPTSDPAPHAAAAAAHATYRHPLRVYWEDTDAGGIVYYANYLKFFERARTEWLRALGVPQQALRDATGAIFVVTDARIGYRRPARLDDQLDVTVRLAAAGRASLVIEQQAWCDDVLLAEGEIRIGCVEAATLRPRRLPDTVLHAMT